MDSTALADGSKKQNEIAALLVKQQQSSLLPMRGNSCVQWRSRSFNKAFEQGTENKTESMQDRLYCLEQFTVGQPQKIWFGVTCAWILKQDEMKQSSNLNGTLVNSIKIASGFELDCLKSRGWTRSKIICALSSCLL